VRTQERNRHLESLLPHFIYCLSQPEVCNWKGRRQSEFKEHWIEIHSAIGQAPGKEENEIYDPKEIVKLIIDGTGEDGTVDVEVVRSAISKAVSEAQERLAELGGGELNFKVVDKCRVRGK
jgi:hypothetical protein